MAAVNRNTDTFLNIRISTEGKEKARKIAQNQNMSMTELIHFMIELLPDPDTMTLDDQRKAFYKLIDLQNERD